MAKQRVGEVLKAMRETKGLTQIKLAEKARVTQSYLAEIETGAKRNPSLDVLLRLARALNVSVAELVE